MVTGFTCPGQGLPHPFESLFLIQIGQEGITIEKLSLIHVWGDVWGDVRAERVLWGSYGAPHASNLVPAETNRLTQESVISRYRAIPAPNNVKS